MAASRFALEVLKHGEAVGIAGDRLAIDQAGTHLEPVNGLDDERIATVTIGRGPDGAPK